MKHSQTKPIINNNDNSQQQQQERITLGNIPFREGIIKIKKSS